MNTISKYTALALTLLLVGFSAQADDNATAPSTPPAETETTEAKPLTWNQLVQKKYSLTDEQMKRLTEAKLNEPNMVRVAHFAQLSNKSIEDVLKMRNESKMGWGQIAKELNVHPSESGKAVSSLRKERNELRKKEKAEKHQQAKQEREDKKEEKRQDKESKRAEREEKRNENKESREIKKAERKENGKGHARK